MKKETILTQIFNALDVVDNADNPFVTRKTTIPYEQFCKKYLSFDKENYDLHDEMWEDLVQALTAEREQAFNVGYTTAIKQIFSILAE